MRIIVLGGMGYLGSKVVRRLIGDGHEVLCVKRSSTSTINLQDILNKIYICDVEQVKEILEWSEPFDCFLNLACLYPRKATFDTQIFESNFYAPLSLFLHCMEQNVRKIVTIGTGLPEDLNAYTISKAKLAEVMKWYGEQFRHKNRPLQICNVLLENFYGEDEPIDRFIPGMVWKLKKGEKVFLTEGSQIRDFVYVADVVEDIVSIINRKDMPEYLDLPLGTGVGVSIKELAQYLKEILNSQSELCFGAIEKRYNEPDSVADLEAMQKFMLSEKIHWKDGMKKFLE